MMLMTIETQSSQSREKGLCFVFLQYLQMVEGQMSQVLSI